MDFLFILFESFFMTNSFGVLNIIFANVVPTYHLYPRFRGSMIALLVLANFVQNSRNTYSYGISLILNLWNPAFLQWGIFSSI